MKKQKILIILLILTSIAIIGSDDDSSDDSSYEHQSSDDYESLEEYLSKQKKRTINAQNEKSFKKNKSIANQVNVDTNKDISNSEKTSVNLNKKSYNSNEGSRFIKTESSLPSSILKKDAIWGVDENDQGQDYNCNDDFYLYNSPHSDIFEQAVYILNGFCEKHDPNHVSFIDQNNKNLVTIEKESTAIDTDFQRNIIFFAVKNHPSNNTSSNDNQVIEKISSENKHIKKEDIIQLCKVLRQHNSSAPLDKLITISFNKYKDLNPK